MEAKPTAAANAAAPVKKKVGSLIIRQSENPTRPIQTTPVSSSASPQDRLLGTENLTDVIPNFPPKSTESDRLWQQASLLPHSRLGVILGHSSQTAWIACYRPSMPPLLLYPLPILGRLPDMPLDPILPHQPS